MEEEDPRKHIPVIISPEILENITGYDFIAPLTSLNTPTDILLYVFEILSPIAFLLNLFVLISCIVILRHGTSDRPSLVLVAYNAALGLGTVLFNLLVVTGAINPSIAETEPLPTEEELLTSCKIEQGLVCFTLFGSLTSVLLLSLDRFLFIAFPLRYDSIFDLHRALWLVIFATLLAVGCATWYALTTELPWDKVCVLPHVFPFGMMVGMHVAFFSIWILMHTVYFIILIIAFRHKKATDKLASQQHHGYQHHHHHQQQHLHHQISDMNEISTITQQSAGRVSTAGVNKMRSRLQSTLKTVRYIVLLLLIYSLVQLPAAVVSIVDLITHGDEHDNHEHCSSDPGVAVALPQDPVTSISFLQCMELFAEEAGELCEVMVLEQDVPLPWCFMAAETSHALRLAQIFELALLGWVANVLANPIIYAFWYPVFRKNLLKVLVKAKNKAVANSPESSRNDNES